jgi:hypothetical protein
VLVHDDCAVRLDLDEDASVGEREALAVGRRRRNERGDDRADG